jgi:DNA-binding NarL/FixJ family response regulator
MVRSGIMSLVTSDPCHKVVLTASNGKELIENLANLPVLPDVCLLDINMPVMNGYNTVAALKKQYPTIKCLALSIFETEYSIISMIKNGARGYLTKTCSTIELLDAIKIVHNCGYYYSNVASKKVFNIVQKADIQPNLTDKEIQFLTLCCSELSFEKIAEQMNVSKRTIDDYQNRLSHKLQVHNRIGLVLCAISSGLVQPKHIN